MSKEDFISGSILEFKLPNSLGYAYCKVLDFRYLREFDGVLVKVFDHIVKEPIKNVMILAEKDWLFGRHDNVKHLEDTVVSPRPAIEIRTAMEYYRKQNVQIMKHFDLGITVNELTYKQMKKVPIYGSIPKEIRGKALSS